MAQQNKAAYEAAVNAQFPTNGTGSIGASRIRTYLGTNLKDSVLFLSDGGQITGNIGIGVSPQRKLHIAESSIDIQGILALDQTNTTDGNGVTITFRGTTSGAGAASFTELGAIQHRIITHNHATRASEINMYASVAGTLTKIVTVKNGVGIKTAAPTAMLHLPAGTATASTAPLKLTTGTALTTEEDGALEYHSSHLYFTIGSTRYQLDQQTSTVTSGTYTPTGSTGVNADSVTPLQATYTRIGSIVTVYGFVQIDPTSASTTTQANLTLPVASNLANNFTSLMGMVSLSNGGGISGIVTADTTNELATLTFNSGTITATETFAYTFRYIVA